SDESLNIYVAGGRGSNAQLMKLSPAGESLWLKVYDFGYPEEHIVSLSCSDDGSIIGAGKVGLGAEQYDFLIVKWSIDGGVLWYQTFDFQAQDEASELISTNYGIYLVGSAGSYSTPPRTPFSTVLLKYSQDGQLQWVKTFRFGEHYWTLGNGLTIDWQGNLLVLTVISDTAVEQSSVILFQCSYDGDTNWTWCYHQDTINCAYRVRFADSASLYVFGTAMTNGQDCFLLVKLAYPQGIEEGKWRAILMSTSNTVMTGAGLHFSLPGAGDYRLVVRDVSGQERLVYAGYLPAGENRISLPSLPAGVYFLELAGAGVQSRRRLVVVK
ncbi:MAG: T9SS type A sorting domain-containing protein, partial [candidate division WOR-3 bacterium]